MKGGKKIWTKIGAAWLEAYAEGGVDHILSYQVPRPPNHLHTAPLGQNTPRHAMLSRQVCEMADAMIEAFCGT
jgi:hypothetical protein